MSSNERQVFTEDTTTVLRLAFGVWRSTFNVQRSAIEVLVVVRVLGF